MPITCTRRIQFCAGHRLLDHEGKCAHIHGHNYVALLTAEAEALDGVGRVIDFAVLKERIGGFIETHWDHGFILNQNDKIMERLLAHADMELEHGQKVYFLQVNPTAENLADHLLRCVGPKALEGTGVRLVRVELWETENCRAEVSL